MNTSLSALFLSIANQNNSGCAIDVGGHHGEYAQFLIKSVHVSPEGRLAFCDAIFIPKELNIPITQKFSCMDDQLSYQTQIRTLNQICAERLDLINLLDGEVRCLNSIEAKKNVVVRILKKAESWVQ